MIAKTVQDCDLSMISRSTSPSTKTFVSLPHEILEQVFILLPIHDRLSFLRTCSVIRNVYIASAPLQYEFALVINAYLDVPYQAPPTPRSLSPSPTPSEESTSDTDRPTIPSVTLAPRPFHATSRTSPPVGSLSASERNQMLEERERRWETLDPAQVRTFRISGPAGVYELQEGMFLMCDDYSDADDGRPSSVRLIPLPSAQDPDLDHPLLPTKSHKLSFAIADLTMDPTQDLIVVSEHRPPVVNGTAVSAPTHRYHLLTLSTFKAHPLASLPMLDFPPFGQPIMQSRQLLQVMDDVLVVLVSRFNAPWIFGGLGLGLAGWGGMGNEEEMVCWNWKTGRVLARVHMPENGWFASFALLSPTTFMVTSTSNISPVMPAEPRSVASVFPPVIQIYSFLPDSNYNIIPVQPLAPDYDDDTTARPVLVAQLELPRFAPGVVVSSFDVRPDPAFPPNTAQSVGQRKSFTQDPEKGVLVFDLHVLEPSDQALGVEDRMTTKAYELFVLRETLVKMARDGEARLREQRGLAGGAAGGCAIWRVEKTISWSDWGEKGSRMMDITMPRRNWVCSCSGYRFVALLPNDPTSVDSDDEDQHQLISLRPKCRDLRVFDFSPFHIHKPLSADCDDDLVTVILHREPTVLDKRRIWKDDVKTELTYQEVIRKVGGVGKWSDD